jgi:hypothetical protein
MSEYGGSFTRINTGSVDTSSLTNQPKPDIPADRARIAGTTAPGYVGVDRIDLPNNASGVTEIGDPKNNIAPTPQELKDMQAGYNNIKLSLEDQISKIADAPIEVDTKALVGEINNRFSSIKNRIMESALTAVQKQGLEMDTYFGSPTGDQRSGARVRMAAAVKNSMMQSAFKSIAGVYDKNTEMVISTQLEGAKLNIQAAATKAQAIAGFTGQAMQAYLGVLSETNKNYSDRLSASVQWAQVQAQARGQDVQFASAMENLRVEQRSQDLQALVTQRGQTIQFNTAQREQDVSQRGQDISKDVSIYGNQVQMRGQDITAESKVLELQAERDRSNLQAFLAVIQMDNQQQQAGWRHEEAMRK